MSEGSDPFDSVLAEIVACARAQKLVVFAGAGLSVPSPSSLPGWGTLNDAFLDALCFRIAGFAHPDINGDQLCEYLIQRRSNHKVISPDFQAQLAEDECGAEYFRLFQTLDIDAWNPGHAAIAALAAAGIVRAIVTTNFDRLIEHALAGAGITPLIFETKEGFDELAALVTKSPDGGKQDVIVIKAHGSVNAPESMVDTLRQRVKGRPRALESAISTLMARHPTLVVGFSGADLFSRPHYLGLAEGAKNCPLFVGASRRGTKPSDELTTLVGAAGERGRLVAGELPEDLETLAWKLGVNDLPRPKWDAEMDSPGIRAERLKADTYLKWAEKLDPLSAANIIAALLESAGAIGTGVEVLHRTWKHIEAPSNRNDGPFLRYVKRFSSLLIDHGLLGSNASSLAVEADKAQARSGNTAFDLVLYSGSDPAHCDAFALAARAAYYAGNPKVSRQMLDIVPRRIDEADTLTAINAHLESAHVCQFLGDKERGLKEATTAYTMAEELGDLPALTRACARQARFLAAAGRWDEAVTRLQQGVVAAERLQHGVLRTEIEASRGAVANRKKDWEAALDFLTRAANAFKKLKRVSAYAETLIDYLYAAYYSGHLDEVAVAREQFESVMPSVPGLEIDYRIWFVCTYVDAEQFPDARQANNYLRWLGQQFGHDRALKFVQEIDAFLDRRETGPGKPAG